tara:strand:+ start:180 stop:1178 length:999 start_codon:yes stop_codon:yes gene_type:complete
MNILITGGAGYIGSHTARALLEQGHKVCVFDNLSRGHKEAVQRTVGLEQLTIASLHDTDRLTQVLLSEGIELVIHLAAFALVGESQTRPEMYFRNNVLGSQSLLSAMNQANVHKLIVSSTTAVYGTPRQMPITESFERAPVNQYGRTKLEMELSLEHAVSQSDLAVVALRYFNAAGAHPNGDLGEDHHPETHLIPITLQVALGQREQLEIFGDDYATPDGTCVRDYVHVCDLASAHICAMDVLSSGKVQYFNIGTGAGTSVSEVLDACRKVSGHSIPSVAGIRRSGDPDILYADNSKAVSELKWSPKYTSIEQIVETAWKWHSESPSGYRSG